MGIESNRETGTKAQLTEDEKALIDDAPDKTVKFLFDYTEQHGVPEYFKLTLHSDTGELKQDVRFDGYERVFAAIEYLESLMERGIRTDFRHE